MERHREGTPHRVVIVGAGVAGLEAMIALHELAGDRVDVTVVAPSDEFTIRAWGVMDPFGHPPATRFDVERMCADHDARFCQDAVHTVLHARREVLTRMGARLGYDSLVLAIGARARAAVRGAITFRGAIDVHAVRAV